MNESSAKWSGFHTWARSRPTNKKKITIITEIN
jgi:hypothetical protein